MDTNPDPAMIAKAMAARKSVVTLFVRKKRQGYEYIDGCGSGFIVRSRGGRGLVMTCHHVVRGELEIRKEDKIFIRGMSGESGIPWQAQGYLIKNHAFVDLAIIKMTGLPEEVQELKFVASEDLGAGTPAVAVGYGNPNDVFRPSDAMIFTNAPCVSPGAISGPTLVSYSEADGTVKEVVPISCVTETGFSGCPVICSGGVFGMVACGDEQITLAVSTETIQLILRKWLKVKDQENLTIEDMLDRFRI